MSRPHDILPELGDSTRLEVLLALLGERKNVSQIVTELGMAQPRVSYHLKKLKDAGLAVEEKDGRWVWYGANWDTEDVHAAALLDLLSSWSSVAASGARGKCASGTRGKHAPRGAGVGGRGRGRPAAMPTPASSPDDRAADDEGRPLVERPDSKEMEDFLL